MTTRSVSIQVNGRAVEASVEPRLLLADFLRDVAGLTGTHLGCEQGVCGACTVLLNGEAVRSCLTFAVQADRQEVTTVEGLALPDEALHPLQQAFHETHALQCGFCTPGFLLSLLSYIERNGYPSDEEIPEVLSGNICRCTGYANIVDAVRLYRERQTQRADRVTVP